MEKSINTVRGGVNPIKINGLVAEQISKDLATKLLDKTYMKNKDNVTINVSANGDDSTADGTEQKPFADLQRAVSYAYQNIKTNAHVTINFLTDFTHSEYLKLVHIQCGRYLIFKSNGHNVTLGRVLCQLGNFSFEGINFKQTDATQEILTVSSLANVYIIENSKIELADSPKQDLIQVWNGTLTFDDRSSITLTSKTQAPNNIFLFLCTYQGKIIFHSAPNITLENNLNAIGFFRCHLNSLILFDRKAVLSAPVRTQAKAYEVRMGAHLSFNGRGKPLNLGGLTEVDQSSSIS